MLGMRSSPISKKLTLMNMLVSGVALLLACAAFFTYDLLTFRAARVRGLNVQAQIIGANSVAAIEFNDPHSAENTLSALRAATNITYAGIYINERQPFASYWRDQPGPAPVLLAIPTGKEDVSKFGNDQVSLAKTIIFQEKKVGTVYLISDLSAIDERLRRYAIIVIIVLLTSLFAALLISRMSQRVVAEPIVNLAETARAVSRDQNYSVRVAPGGNKDEVSTLIAAFNEMLGQIQQRDSALHQAHDLLEGRVKERTAELKAAEERLRMLSTRLLQLQDEERRNIARELHDSTGQTLTALKISVALLQRKLRDDNEIAEELSEIERLTESAIREIRTTSYLLPPPLLDEACFASAAQ